MRKCWNEDGYYCYWRWSRSWDTVGAFGDSIGNFICDGEKEEDRC